jgi:hypothetical protein
MIRTNDPGDTMNFTTIRPGFLSRRAALVLAALAVIAAPVQAQGPFPDKPVKFVVPYPPGGGTDVIARIVQERFQHALGQPIVIDNRGGAAGSLGTDIVAKVAGRRLHGAVHAVVAHDQPVVLFEAAVRHREGLRAGRHRRVAAADPGRESAVPGQHGRRADRGGEGQGRTRSRSHRSATARPATSPASC